MIKVIDDGRRPPFVELGSAIVSPAAWVQANVEELRSLLRRHGALLLRGLGALTVEDFGRVREALISEPVAYREKATPRSAYGNSVYSSTDLPPQQSIQLHNENSYTLRFPGLLLFGCLQAPQEGGATTVGSVRTVLDHLPAELVQKFRRLGWLLVRNYQEHLGLAWQDAFATTERAAMADYCARSCIGFEWREGGGLRTTQRRPAVLRHPRTGQEVWFNHIAFWHEASLDSDLRDVLVSTYGSDGLPFNTYYGDGSVISDEEIALINAAYAVSVRREAWQVGDVLLVDNVLAAHGRDAFIGPREVVVAMGEELALEECSPSIEPTSGAVDG